MDEKFNPVGGIIQEVNNMWVFSVDLFCADSNIRRGDLEKLRKKSIDKNGVDLAGITWPLDIDGAAISNPNNWNIIERHDGNVIPLIMCEDWCVELTDINDPINLTGPIYDSMTTKDYNEEGI